MNKAKPLAPADRQQPNDQTRTSQHGKTRGKLPHERDESGDTQFPMPDQDRADKAYDDAASDRVDTDCALGATKDCPGNPTKKPDL